MISDASLTIAHGWANGWGGWMDRWKSECIGEMGGWLIGCYMVGRMD